MFIEITDLTKSFGTDENRTTVLQGICFSIEKSEICVLLGPSGSGKSTLLNIIGELTVQMRVMCQSTERGRLK